MIEKSIHTHTHTHTHTHLLEREITTLSSILAWESYGQGSLMGYSPWDQKESDTTEQLPTHTYTSIETQKRRAMHEKHKTFQDSEL